MIAFVRVSRWWGRGRHGERWVLQASVQTEWVHNVDFQHLIWILLTDNQVVCWTWHKNGNMNFWGQKKRQILYRWFYVTLFHRSSGQIYGINISVCSCRLCYVCVGVCKINCVCVGVSKFICVGVCKSSHLQWCNWKKSHSQTHRNTHIQIYTLTLLVIHAHIYIYNITHMHTHTHARTHARAHTHTHRVTTIFHIYIFSLTYNLPAQSTFTVRHAATLFKATTNSFDWQIYSMSVRHYPEIITKESIQLRQDSSYKSACKLYLTI